MDGLAGFSQVMSHRLLLSCHTLSRPLFAEIEQALRALAVAPVTGQTEQV